MNDRPGILSPESLPRPGEVALLTAIDAVLEVPASELPEPGRAGPALRRGGAGGGSRHPPRHVPGDRADARPRRRPRLRRGRRRLLTRAQPWYLSSVTCSAHSVVPSRRGRVTRRCSRRWWGRRWG